MNARLMGRPARAAAALGALVAAGAVTLVATMGTANAAGAGRCIDNVNVRAQPDISSKIVAVCERGQAVQVGQTRDGFVQLTDLKGWAAQEFVSVDGHVGSAPSTPRTTSAEPKPKPAEGGGRGSSTARDRNPAFSDPFGADATDNDGTDGTNGTNGTDGQDRTGQDRTADESTSTATPTANADSTTDGDDAPATDTDAAAAPTTQASQPASPMGALGHLLG